MGDRVILHSDINCCYASIEHLHHPELAGKPLAVGGDPEARHGIVLTADYIAKKYGVKTGMALWQAKQVCPDITFVSPRMDLYLRFSRMAHEIYAEYTDRQEPYGEESVHVLPDNVSLLSASLTEPLACGVHAVIEKGNVQPGDICVVFGAGAIGQMVAQVAKGCGATVIMAGLTNDAERFKIAKECGIDVTVDQMTQDLKSIVMEMTNNEGADKCFECSGAVVAANTALDLCRRKGTVVQMGVFSKSKVEICTDWILHKEINYVGSRSQKPSSWVKALELMADGKVVPEKTAKNFVTLENWRDGFDRMAKGEGAKWVITIDEELE